MSVLRRVRNVLGVGQVEQRAVWWQVVLLAALIPLGATIASTLLQSVETSALADDEDRDLLFGGARDRGGDRPDQWGELDRLDRFCGPSEAGRVSEVEAEPLAELLLLLSREAETNHEVLHLVR